MYGIKCYYVDIMSVNVYMFMGTNPGFRVPSSGLNISVYGLVVSKPRKYPDIMSFMGVTK